MKKSILAFTVSGVLLTASAQAAPDWSKVPKRDIQVFHAGITTIEWTMKKSDHSGRTGMVKGESCVGCHEEKGGLNFNMKRMASKELEPVAVPQTMNFPVSVQAAYDKDNAYLRLSFKPPVGSANKDDKENDVKATVLFANDKVAVSAGDKSVAGPLVGCWASCHNDARTMPGADEHKTKYTKDGAYELMQWKSAKGAKAVDGSVSDKRSMDGGTAGVRAEGDNKGGIYTVTFTRKLNGALGEGKTVPFGVAVHADHATGRFHHVSMGYTLGFGADGDIKVTKQ
ncbi:ethylbenzene dehydrogenase-related protein [Propionivibrio sp.]|uniref:ethylbenzene dehydrogenase-related protein n=1 Tax=Propionivibrio sp. TaxID=2212460 RepID=UPI00260E014E|nr:ethylbenzene dehydrogenase-related protein [Propionivibrio sp.]